MTKSFFCITAYIFRNILFPGSSFYALIVFDYKVFKGTIPTYTYINDSLYSIFLRYINSYSIYFKNIMFFYVFWFICMHGRLCAIACSIGYNLFFYSYFISLFLYQFFSIRCYINFHDHTSLSDVRCQKSDVRFVIKGSFLRPISDLGPLLSTVGFFQTIHCIHH